MSHQKLFILSAPSILVFAAFAFSQVSLNTGSIYGKVLGPDGKPLSNVSVLREAEGMAPKTTTTGASGTFLFPALVPGNYSLTFSLQGFSEIRQEDVPVSSGQTVALQITLQESLEETLVISGETPVVDPKRTGTSTVFTQSYLTKIPNARDPWVILDQTPGIDVNQINVGGNYSGQQSRFTARGASFSSNLWSYDGIDISDPAESGGTPAYWDFDSFEEIQITTGGADASIRTGGVVINFITKRGGNRWAGQASAYFDNDSLESNNVDADLVAQHFVSPNKISRLYEYGGDAGGPLIKDKAWIWGAYRFQSIANITPGVLVHDSAENLNGTIAGQAPDLTELENINLKFNVAYNTSQEGVFQYLFSSKDKFGLFFLAPNQLAADSTLDQTGSGNMFKAEHSWLPNSNWFLSAKFAYFPGSGHIHPKANGAHGQPVIRLNEDFFWEHGSLDFDATRPKQDVTFDVNYFLQNKLGGDHEFKFGFAYKQSSATSLFQYGGDVLLYDFAGQRGDTSAGFGLARIIYDITADFTLSSAGFYAADTWRWKHLTLNLGLRFDTSTATSAPSVSTANSVAPDLLPEMRFPGTDPGVRYNTFAPRVGATWDITGSGKTIVRGNYARFYDNVSVDTVTFTNPLLGYTGVYVYYYDANGDGTITRDELLDNYYGIYGTIGFIVPGDADATVAGFPDHRFFEPGLQPEQTQEFLIGFERGIKQNISVAATFTHRKYDHLQDVYIPGITSADFICSPLPVQNPVTGETFSTNFCDVPGSLTADNRKEGLNTHGRTRSYNGLEMVINKRMTANWMLRASATWQDQKIHYEDNSTVFGGSFQDPTNIPFTNNEWSPGFDILGSRWSIKVVGAYQLPWELTIGAYYKIIDGNAAPIFARKFQNYRQGAFEVLLKPFDAERFDTVQYMDLRAEKGIALRRYGTLFFIADVFNVFNTNTAVKVERRANAFQFREPQEIVNPRIFRFGLRYTF